MCKKKKQKARGGGVCVGARARARRALLFGRPLPTASPPRTPKGGTPGQRCRRRRAWRRVAGLLRAWPAGATRETPFPRSMPAAACCAPHPPPRKGGTSNRSRPGRGRGGTLAARGERAVGAQRTCDREARSAFRYRRRSVPVRLAARAPLAVATAAAGSLSPPLS